MANLNTARLRTLTKPGAYGDGGGLYLQVRGPEHRSWLYRFKLHGKPHLMGLGTFADLSLAEARDVASAARKLVRQGINPVDQRRAQRAENAAQAGLTFARCRTPRSRRTNQAGGTGSTGSSGAIPWTRMRARFWASCRWRRWPLVT